MDSTLKEALFESLRIVAPSGAEEQVTDLFSRFVSPYVDEVYTDVNGNCIAHKCGTGQKVMLMAHADEIGLMINYIDDHGFLYFKEIGGIDTSILPTQSVVIKGHQGWVKGVIGRKPIHLQEKFEHSKDRLPESTWIDIAAKDKDDALSKVQIGSVATFTPNAFYFSDTLISSKSLDDRIGLAVLMGIAQSLDKTKTDFDIYLVASVQEELGARGAKMVTEAIRPDIGIAIDVTHATDYPSMQSLAVMADKKGILYQLEAISKPTGTDAREIQVAASGIKTGLISIPCRYMHTPFEVVSLDDADNAIVLLTEFLHVSKPFV